MVESLSAPSLAFFTVFAPSLTALALFALLGKCYSFIVLEGLWRLEAFAWEILGS